MESINNSRPLLSLAKPCLATLIACSLFMTACGKQENDEAAKEAFSSTYQALESAPVFIQNATILLGNGEKLNEANILLKDGKIEAVGKRVKSVKGAIEIDATGKYVTPGVIDTHSHLGVYPSPGTRSHRDGNEAVAPVTADVWAEHSVWPQDPGFITALAGGVTSMQILPGSANLFGGRSVTVKNVPAHTYQAMKFPGAPHGLKMACGENPKRVYGDKGGPQTRMGNVAGYRRAWIDAADYLKKSEAAAEGSEPPKRDLKLETLAGVLKGEILVHNHCYRADEMATMLDLAKEFDYKVTSFHHAIEAYKIGDLLAANDTCASMWADWWGFKMEAFDMVRENIPMVEAAGACAIVHSDSGKGIQRLHQEAAKAMASGQRVGLDYDEATAISWITQNPAKALGILEHTGTLEEGKMADVVLWSDSPFSVYTHAEKVFVDGALIYDRFDESKQPVTDFSLGVLNFGAE
ncbi:MAG: amidohydrolase [Gammaproteobacteria bacterium]|nr:amidohydrolase [Gammaproteobacteria bacterium]NNC97919.1 amidohydrolase [Gammaproteobacteria bacterium]NNM14283.1 amidohydrolase [Gammaproteobacteria bacterium]